MDTSEDVESALEVVHGMAVSDCRDFSLVLESLERGVI